MLKTSIIMGESWEMALKDAASEFQSGILDNQNMDKKEPNYSNFMHLHP